MTDPIRAASLPNPLVPRAEAKPREELSTKRREALASVHEMIGMAKASNVSMGGKNVVNFLKEGFIERMKLLVEALEGEE